MRLLRLPTLLSALSFASALPALTSPQQEALAPASDEKPLPLLIWHGLGDTYDADGLRETGKLVQQLHPGTYIYYVRVDDDSTKDRTGTFFGNITSQIAQVCDDIHQVPELRRTDGQDGLRVDALGFSQGGQFLRGLLERCDGLSIRSLVTFGSQHNGIAQFPACSAYDFLCKAATGLIKGNAWTEYIQNRVVPAQYYRSVNETTGLPTQDYLDHSNFLADVNNERAAKNETYRARVAGLERFVMYVFANDTTVIPKESGWFAEVNATDGVVTPLKDRPIYQEDWLGLKQLDERGGLILKEHPNGHMQLEDKVLVEAFNDFFGPERKTKGLVSEAEEEVEEQLRLLQDELASHEDWMEDAKEFL